MEFLNLTTLGTNFTFIFPLFHFCALASQIHFWWERFSIQKTIPLYPLPMFMLSYLEKEQSQMKKDPSMACCSLMASKHTLALNSGVNSLLLVLLIFPLV